MASKQDSLPIEIALAKVGMNMYLRETESGRTTPVSDLQGWAKVWFPGFVNMRRKSCVLLPAAGSRTQLFASFSRNLGTVL